MADLLYSLDETAEKLGMSETVLVRLSQYFRIPRVAYEKEVHLSFKGELYFTHQDLTFFRQIQNRIVDGESLSEIQAQLPSLDKKLTATPEAISIASEPTVSKVSKQVVTTEETASKRVSPALSTVSEGSPMTTVHRKKPTLPKKGIFQKIAEQTRAGQIKKSPRVDSYVRPTAEQPEILKTPEISDRHPLKIRPTKASASNTTIAITEPPPPHTTQTTPEQQKAKHSESSKLSKKFSKDERPLWVASKFSPRDPLGALFPQKPSRQDPFSINSLAIDERYVHREGKTWPRQELNQESEARKKLPCPSGSPSEPRLTTYSQVGETFTSGFKRHSGLKGSLQRAANQLKQRALESPPQAFTGQK